MQRAGVIAALGTLRYPTAATYVGWLGHNNVGDEWLYRIICGDRRISVSAESLFWLRMQLALRRLLRRPVEIIGLGGGTLIGPERTAEQLSMLFKAFPSATLRVLGSGAEAGVWDLRWPHLLARAETPVSVRGPRTAKRLCDFGVRSQCVGDPGFLLGRNIKQTAQVDLLLNISPALLRAGGPTAVEHFIREARLASAGCRRIRVIVMSPEDLQLSRRLARRLPMQVEVVRAYRAKKPEPGIFAARSAFGVRLHFAIFCIAVGTPVHVVAYHDKAHDLAESLGAPVVLTPTDAWPTPEDDSLSARAKSLLDAGERLSMSAARALREWERA